MRSRTPSLSKSIARSRQRNERGVALVTTLLLLLLLTGMSVAMVLSVSSDMLINGYYANSRGSFYAADSGLNVTRQAMISGLLGLVPGTFSATTAPLTSSAASTVTGGLTGYTGGFTSLNSGSATYSWPEKFKITSLSLAPAASPTQPQTTKDALGNVTSYAYTYVYSLTSVGQSQGTEAATLMDSGRLVITVGSTPAGPVNTSFAAWGMFIDQYPLCGGGTLVPGLITGPVFTNGAWNFGSSGSYEFTDKVGSANAQAGYQNGSCQAVAAASGNGISPKFDQGFLMGQPTVPLPTNDYNQKLAVLDSMGIGGTNPTQAQMGASLKNASGTAYPPTGGVPSSGVYLPYTISGSGTKTFTGGGIYVKGDAKVTVSIPTSGAGASTQQIYTIVQGSSPVVTTTVTIDNSNDTTTFTQSNGSTTSTQSIAGVPEQRDPSTGAITRDATMLYVDGNITGLSGPAAGQAGIQDNTALTITAAGSVTVTGDVLYKTEPVTTSGTTPDTLIAGNDHGQVLGIFTATGDVNLANSQSSGTLQIDASVATISQSGSGGIVNTGSKINTLTIVGGRIQNTIQNINSTTRNVFFDRRFASNGFAPPWFPSTTVTTTAPPSTAPSVVVQRTQWLNHTTYQ